jgi:hypothetical protein
VLDHKLLSIYLNDHLAGSRGGIELARRALSNNEGTPFGEFLATLVRQIEEDRAALIRLMDRLDIGRDRPKEAAAWGLERAGRLKLNGRLVGYSPLSRLVEFESLLLGVTGKRSMWRSLLIVVDEEPRLEREELATLATRAESQVDGLEAHRGEVVVDALGAGVIPPGKR